ncbi:MAG TPA: hypothetical protein VK645_06915 [Chitinophagaceae bacterium]|nr:hypothetical protein [Chitinophagaceae bacterium]
MSEQYNQKRNFLLAIPYIALTIGLFSFLYGTFGTFEFSAWKEFWSGFGKTVLASGIFALLLKTIQFMGVFKEELSKIIYDAKFLENRKDLPEVWENVSRVMFKNKFPKISQAIMHDIRNLYFPTEHVLYYDDYKQILEIELIDEEAQKIEVRQHSTFTIYPKDKKEKFTQQTTNRLYFNKSKDEVFLEITSYKINDKEKNLFYLQMLLINA